MFNTINNISDEDILYYNYDVINVEPAADFTVAVDNGPLLNACVQVVELSLTNAGDAGISGEPFGRCLFRLNPAWRYLTRQDRQLTHL